MTSSFPKPMQTCHRVRQMLTRLITHGAELVKHCLADVTGAVLAWRYFVSSAHHVGPPQPPRRHVRRRWREGSTASNSVQIRRKGRSRTRHVGARTHPRRLGCGGATFPKKSQERNLDTTDRMAPNMKKETQQRELLITGLACRLPESPSTQSFWENLVAGVDMISKNDEHWEQGRNSTEKLMLCVTLVT